jgi:AraC-like DNA-binding protein
MSEMQVPRVLEWHAAPPALARWVLGFVHRDEAQTGQVMRFLPEPRPSIQLMLADSVYLRDRAEHAPWRQLPTLSLWAPSFDWCYGYARSHIKAYALGLTNAGYKALLTRAMPDPAHACSAVQQTLSQQLALADLAPTLAQALMPASSESFSAWRKRANAALVREFQCANEIDPLLPALPILATSSGSAVAQAAQACGVSERQFRRLFESWYGVSPKRYQRAVRVDRVLRQLHAKPWEADDFAAFPNAFADQPHAIREFKLHTGLTPRQYWLAKRDGDLSLRSLPAKHVAPP